MEAENGHARRVSVRLVLVDDNGRFLDAARDLLEREGMTVVAVASSTAEAIAVVEGQRPDAVLVDIDLGAESGLDLAVRLAADDWPVILISAYDLEDYGELIDASPAIGFVSKPLLSARAISDVLASGSPEKL
jgi:CheY-like chemotaxis protein